MDQRPHDPIEQPVFVHHDLPTEPPRRPPLIFAPIWLFFRPRNFFVHYVTEPVFALTAVFALLFGLSRAMDRMDLKIAQGKLVYIADSWAAYWVVALISGGLGGLLYFYIGGWWYRLRLKWAGAQNPDPHLARRLYLYASQILAIPAVLVTLIDSAMYPTPIEAVRGDQVWQAVLLVFPFWSVFASFRGARAIFDIGFLRALFWLALLPAAFYSIAIVLMLALFSISPTVLKADTTNRNSFENALFTFEYPGNWFMDLSEGAHDHESHLWLDASAEGYVSLEIYEPEGSAESELALAMANFEERYGQITSTGSVITQWSGIECASQTLLFEYEGTQNRATIVVVPLKENKFVDITMVTTHDDALYNLPGFNLITLTFRVRPN